MGIDLLTRQAGGWFGAKLLAAACILLLLQGKASAEFPLDPACAAARDLPYPSADLPTPEEAKALSHCNSSALFFGFNGQIDTARARKCAYLEMDGKVDSKSEPDKDFGRSYPTRQKPCSGTRRSRKSPSCRMSVSPRFHPMTNA